MPGTQLDIQRHDDRLERDDEAGQQQVEEDVLAGKAHGAEGIAAQRRHDDRAHHHRDADDQARLQIAREVRDIEGARVVFEVQAVRQLEAGHLRLLRLQAEEHDAEDRQHRDRCERNQDREHSRVPLRGAAVTAPSGPQSG